MATTKRQVRMDQKANGRAKAKAPEWVELACRVLTRGEDHPTLTEFFENPAENGDVKSLFGGGRKVYLRGETVKDFRRVILTLKALKDE